MNRKKLIEAYFLQKAGSKYTEQSLLFLFDLLRREGLASDIVSMEQVATDLGTLVRDGSHLHISSRKLPEHIRTQIDFFLHKSKKAKATGSRGGQSTFDDLLSSLDSDDPRFTMDTTLGLDFSTMEDLEASLKKKAMDSISPSLFKKNTNVNFGNYNSPVSAKSYDEFDETGMSYEDSMKTDLREAAALASKKHSSAILQSDNHVSHDSHVSHNYGANADTIQVTANPLNSPVPHYPHLHEQNASGMNPGLSYANNQVVASSFNAPYFSAPAQTSVMLSELRMRAALVDAKEKIMSQRIGSLNDPVLLRALALLDERLLKLKNPLAYVPSVNLLSGSSQVEGASSSIAMAGSAVSSSPSVISQACDSIGEIVNLQKAMQQLSTQISSSNLQTHRVESVVDKKSITKEHESEIKSIRTQVTNLQNHIEGLATHIKSLVSKANVREQPVVHVQPEAIIVNKKTGKGKNHVNKTVGQLQAAVVEANDASAVPMHLVRRPVAYDGSLSVNPMTTNASQLQKMYALISVGMRELHHSPHRAKAMYEHLQRLYAALSPQDKPIIYPSVVEFYYLILEKLAGGPR